MPEAGLRPLVLSALVFIHLGLALLLGSVASRLWMRGASSTWTSRTSAKALALGRLGLAFGLVGIFCNVWFEAAVMAETGARSAGPTLVALLGHTHFGHAWLLGLGAWVVASALLIRSPRRISFVLGLSAVAVFVYTRSIVSHAGSQGDFTADVAMDWLHLVLVCLWVGIVVVGASLEPPEVQAPREGQDAMRWVARISSTATVVLACIFVTGTFKVWRGIALVGSLGGYFLSDYGRILVVKLLLVGLAALLGGINRFVVLPRMSLAPGSGSGSDAATWNRSLLVILRFELLTLVIVLAVAAALSSTEYPISQQ